MKHFEFKFIAFFLGFAISALLSLSIKYPLEVDSIDKYKAYCINSKIEQVKVGLSGDIYYVKCSNGYQTPVHH